ncbi:MAG: PfkB family carbohydrate kinase, partial [Limisphaerales bacterium]
PQKYIAGSAGAGDAFCAGVLMGLHESWDIQQCLKAGVCAAASSLSHPTCTGGIQPLQDCLKLPKRYPPRKALT